ncbi:hypothetical protein AB3347_08860 [Massilia sp. X63]
MEHYEYGSTQKIGKLLKIKDFFRNSAPTGVIQELKRLQIMLFHAVEQRVQLAEPRQTTAPNDPLPKCLK